MVGKAAPFLPIPAGVATVVNKVMDKVTTKTGIDLTKVKISKGETLGDVANRSQVGAGAAAAAFADAADKPGPDGVNPLVFGFAREKVKKIVLVSALIAGLYWTLKKLRIL